MITTALRLIAEASASSPLTAADTMSGGVVVVVVVVDVVVDGVTVVEVTLEIGVTVDVETALSLVLVEHEAVSAAMMRSEGNFVNIGII